MARSLKLDRLLLFVLYLVPNLLPIMFCTVPGTCNVGRSLTVQCSSVESDAVVQYSILQSYLVQILYEQRDCVQKTVVQSSQP